MGRERVRLLSKWRTHFQEQCWIKTRFAQFSFLLLCLNIRPSKMTFACLFCFRLPATYCAKTLINMLSWMGGPSHTAIKLRLCKTLQRDSRRILNLLIEFVPRSGLVVDEGGLGQPRE